MNSDTIWEVTCRSRHITHCYSEKIMSDLFELGAVDVFLPVTFGEKTSISVLCNDSVISAVLEYLSSQILEASVFSQQLQRSILNRSFYQEETDFGIVRHKKSMGYGVKRDKAEYEDLSRIAKSLGVSVPEAKKLLKKY